MALLVGLAVLGAVAAATIGLTALDRDQEKTGIAQAERSLSQFDARSSEVALGRSSGTRIDFGLPDTEGSLSARPDAGRMQIEYVRLGSSPVIDSTTVVNVTLGAVVFQQDDRTVGYQAGGVFRSNGEGSVLLSRPEFQFRDGTLTIPVIRVEGGTPLASTVQVTPNGTVRRFPDAARNLTNPLGDEPRRVRITVQSQYYQAWAEYFRAETDSIVAVDPATETATVTFLVGADEGRLASGIIATAESGLIKLGGQGVYVDSYNSSKADGTYKKTQSYNGELTAVGDITSTGSATVEGNLTSGGVVSLSGTTDINNGTIRWTDDYINKGDASKDGTANEIEGVATVPPIDGYVRNVVRSARQSNDNNKTNLIKSGSLALTGSGTLTAGTYYVDTLEVDAKDNLTIDTSSGDVTIAVGGYVEIEGAGNKGAALNVIGNNTTRIVVGGEEDLNGTDFFVGKSVVVDVPANRSPQLRIYGTSSFVGVVTSNQGQTSRFEGLIYAPAGLYGDSSILVRQVKYWGGIVAGDLTIKQYAEVHYDRSLENIPLPRAPTQPRLEFMHVSVHRMNVTAG